MFYVGLFGVFYDNLVYFNIKWYLWMGKLEWLFVIFCYYSLYYIDIGVKNLGSYFIIFDYIFGIYIDLEIFNFDE